MVTFSKKELELMEIFWDAGEPLARQEMLDRAESRKCSWKANSIHILLNQLLKKRAIQVTGFYINNRKFGRSFEAAITKREYYVMQVRMALEEAKDKAGLTPKRLLRDLLKEEKEKQ